MEEEMKKEDEKQKQDVGDENSAGDRRVYLHPCSLLQCFFRACFSFFPSDPPAQTKREMKAAGNGQQMSWMERMASLIQTMAARRPRKPGPNPGPGPGHN